MATIIGTSNPDALTGGVAGDLIYGYDTVAGDTGVSDNDTLAGLDGNDTIVAGSGDDLILGGAGADSLIGGTGDDTITGDSGNDTLAGEAGVDVLDYSDSPARVMVNMSNLVTIVIGADTAYSGTALDGFGTTDLISGFENVIGSSFDDYIMGNDAANRLEGGAGDDVLWQTRGHDTLDGGDGFNDRLTFSGNGITYGGAIGANVNLGAGTSDADPGNGDTVNGAGGDVASISNIEAVTGTVGNDVLTGGSLARSSAVGTFTEAFFGNAGNDTIDGQGTDTVQGAFDIDRVEYNNAPFSVVVNLGLAAIVTPYGLVNGGTARDGTDSLGGGTDTLLHVNHLRGSNLADTLVGGNTEYDSTFERFEGRGGNDFIDGGSGSDEASYQGASGAVSASLATGTSSGADGVDTLINIERLRGSAFADTLTGGNNASVVEFFTGDGGNDTIDGGAGIDFAMWLTSSLAVNAFIENGAGTVSHADNGIDTLINIEGLVGTSFGDTLAGGAGEQWFHGRGGNDSLSGGAGNDWADYASDPGAVTVNLATNSATDGWGGIWGLQGTDTLGSIENVLGSNFNDALTGDTGANQLSGGNGNDTLDGGAGSDSIGGGNGNDNILGGDGNDTVQGNAGDDFVRGAIGDDEVRGGQGNDTVQGGQGVDVVRGAFGNDELRGGLGDDQIFGGQNNDTLFGGQGADTLLGLAHDDVLQGLAGNDLLTGGPGLDQFWFNSAGALNADTIFDFDFGGDADTIVLQQLLVTGLSPGALAAGNFVSGAGAAAADADDYILYDTATGNLSYDADGSGAGGALLIATLTGAPALTAGDFLIVA